LRQQAESARSREHRTAALYALSRDLARTRGRDNLLDTAVEHIGGVFGGEVAIFVLDEPNPMRVFAARPADWVLDVHELGVVRWVHEHGQPAGRGTTTLPGSDAFYLPLNGARGTVGVLAYRAEAPDADLTLEQVHLFETFANQSALALERAMLAEETERTRVQMETEQLRSSLLSSVSHDLRTPLATVTGAASALLADEGSIGDAERRALLRSIFDEAERLNRLVGNLVHMTRLESGAIRVEKAWQPLEEVVGSALERLQPLLGGHSVAIQIPTTLPLVPIDAVLIEQVLINLLENAARYVPPSTTIEISAEHHDAEVAVVVQDRGPGFRPGDEQRVFDKFFRAATGAAGLAGAGLGLAICRGIVEAHGGRIEARNRSGGGAMIRFTLPLEGTPPPEIPAAAR
jgi:two-component system sensor histidine kinase KdpD